MTTEEVSRQYGIPSKILKEYEKWGGFQAVEKVTGDWKYDDEDLERLSLMMTLHEIGFEAAEVETYMSLVIQGGNTKDARLEMLQKKRDAILDRIHFQEKQLSHLDYLRYEMKNNEQEIRR